MLEIRKNTLLLKVLRHRSRLPREVVRVPNQAVSKDRLDKALSILI